jgi:hypothetical protein
MPPETVKTVKPSAPTASLRPPVLVRVTRRAFCVGLTLALGLCAVTPYNDYYVGATYIAGNLFPIGALGAILLLVLLVNPLLISLGRRSACFAPTEILTVWAMMIVAAGIPSSGLMRYLIPHLAASHYYASRVNGWEALMVSRLPARLLVSDPAAVKRFFEGLPRGAGVPWQAWATPLLWWGLFVGCLFLAYFCLATLVRRQWVENQRFSFPLVQLPVLLAEAPEPGHRFNTVLRSPLLWAGVSLTTVLHTVKGLHQFFPTLPDIPTAWHSSHFITARPWSGVNDIGFFVYPLLIGFAFLLSGEVSRSLWLFYLVLKVQMLLGVMYEWDMAAPGAGYSMGPAFAVYQEAGGALMVVAWVIWGMRAHLKQIWRKATTNAKDVDDSREPLSYRFALFGLAEAYAGMFLWLTLAARMQSGMTLGVLVGSLVIFVMLSWLVAQAGLLFAQQAFAPSQLMTVFEGGAAFNARSLLAASLVEQVGWRDAREFMMPSLLNSFKGAAETMLDARALTRALAVTVLLATVVSAAVSIWLPYTHGGGTALRNPWTYIAAPQTTLSWAADQIHAPRPPSPGAVLQIGGGAVFVLLLFVARNYIPGFDLHPAGFLVAASYPMHRLWFSILLGCLLKAPIVRYGGLGGYRRALPFFLGLILGDCVNALVWVAVGLATGTGYTLLPG